MTDKDIDKITDVDELIKLSREYIENQQFDEGIKFVTKALELKPDDLNILNSMGFAYGRSGNYEEAIKYYKKALEIEPNFQKALGNLGHVYEMQEKFEEAIEYYERSLEAKPEDEDLCFPENIVGVVKEHLHKAREQLTKE
ncbi:MAG: tetratricopeptide repeat protein [Asgard group archaeon]|nr:tetratricopeptide repeat protein [Asgard group archaeon]